MATTKPVTKKQLKIQEIDAKAVDILTRTRTRLVVGDVFLATMALYMQFIPDRSVYFMATNGSAVFYNPNEVCKRSPSDVSFVLAHEIMHVVFNHHLTRVAPEDNAIFQVAADHVVNLYLAAQPAYARVPHDAVMDSRFLHMSAGEVFDILKSEQPPPEQDQDQGDGDGESGSGGGSGSGSGGEGRNIGGVTPPKAVQDADGVWNTTAEDLARKEVLMRVMAAAALARQAGTLPGDLEVILEQLVAPKHDWRDLVRMEMLARTKEESSWKRPNRRYVHHDMLLPSRTGHSVGNLVLVLDTSGSMFGDAEITSPIIKACSEILGIVEDVNPSHITIISSDAEVSAVQEYDDAQSVDLTKCKGGGGTDFRPAFNYVETRGNSPDLLIYLTDGFGPFPATEPDYPVMWVVASSDVVPPFGDIVRV